MKCRRKDYAWRNLGYVPRIVHGKGRAQRLLESAEHVDADKYRADPQFRTNFAPQFEGDTPKFDGTFYGKDAQAKLPEIKAQDLHTMLQVMLSPYKKLQDRGGMFWEQRYRGETIKLLLIPFLLFVKADGQEADKLMGHFVPKTVNIANLCRFCPVPTKLSHDPYPETEYPLKTMDMIIDLLRKKDLAALQQMSQHPIWNAFYDLRCGLHNKGGIHQACPLDMLHYYLLGQFGYNRDNFFAQTGKDSNLSANLNGIAIYMGILFQRQSDTDKPRTKFTKGVKDGFVMGHEMEGVMIVLLATLRSTRGRNFILEEARGKQREYLPDERFIQDWIMLIETKLELHQWLHA